MPDTVVLANGSFPTHPIPLSQIQHASQIICCDGAAEALVAFGRTPDWIVGDLDSIPVTLKEKFAPILVHDPDQETNDLTKAVHFCVQRGITAISILGATGKRDDHMIGNLALLPQYTKRLRAHIITDHGTFRIVRDEATLAATPGQQISLFSLTPHVPITTAGLKFPIKNRCLDELWQGTLNEALDSQFSLFCPNGTLLVFQLFP